LQDFELGKNSQENGKERPKSRPICESKKIQAKILEMDVCKIEPLKNLFTQNDYVTIPKEYREQ